MKTWEEMTFDERVSYATGLLTMSIGEGRFRGQVASLIMTCQQEAYDRGFRAGGEAAKKKAAR